MLERVLGRLSALKMALGFGAARAGRKPGSRTG